MSSKANFLPWISIVLLAVTSKLGEIILLSLDILAILNFCAQSTNARSSPTATMRHCGKNISCISRHNPNITIAHCTFFVPTPLSSATFPDKSLIIGCNCSKNKTQRVVDSSIFNYNAPIVHLTLFSTSRRIPKTHPNVNQIQGVHQCSSPLLNHLDHLHQQHRHHRICCDLVCIISSKILQRHRCSQSAEKLLRFIPILLTTFLWNIGILHQTHRIQVNQIKLNILAICEYCCIRIETSPAK